MYKQILTFSLALLLTACATARVRQIPTQVRAYQKVNFFEFHRQVAFKASGEMNGNQLEGVLQIKKIGENDFDVLLMASGAYRVLHAIVTPQGITYRYLFKDIDNAPVRGKINQFLYLLLGPLGTYERYQPTKDGVLVWYKNDHAKIKLTYQGNSYYPASAHTVTALNTAVMYYSEYAPSTADGEEQLPHELVYEDGKVILTLDLISLK